MALVDPAFGDTLFSALGAECVSFTVDAPRSVDSQDAAYAQGGASSDGKLSPRSVSMTVRLVAATQATLANNYHALLEATGRGKQDLHLEPQFANKHLLCQRKGVSQLRVLEGTDGLVAMLDLEFLADAPYFFANNASFARTTLNAATVTVSVSCGGNAVRTPIMICITAGATTIATDTYIKFTNTSTQPNDTWRYKTPSALTTGQQLWIDGESFEVLHNGTYDAKGFAGAFPSMVGGKSNNLRFDTSVNLVNATADILWSDLTT